MRLWPEQFRHAAIENDSGAIPAMGKRHHSLKSPLCSCVSITLPAAS